MEIDRIVNIEILFNVASKENLEMEPAVSHLIFY